MPSWHEVQKNQGGWQFATKPGSRVAVLFTEDNVREAPFQGHFLRYDGPGAPTAKGLTPWRQNPEGWFELWPREPLLASTMDEAKALFTPLLPHIEDGSIDDQFEMRPYTPPAKSEFIKDLTHSARVAFARIVRWPDGLFEVKYYVYAPNGRYFPASTPSISTELEWEWGVTQVSDEEGRPLRTLADDLESAEKTAVEELDNLVARDPEIKLNVS